MDEELVKVRVLNRERDWFITKIKIVEHLPDGGAKVDVEVLDKHFDGEITSDVLPRMLALRGLGEPVTIEDEENALMKWLNEGDPSKHFTHSKEFLEEFGFLIKSRSQE